MTERIPNPACPKCGGKQRSSNSYKGARQLKCEDCSHRERRTLAGDLLVPPLKWAGSVKNPPCCKCNGKMHSSNFRDNTRQLKCISCGNRERRVLGTNELIPNRVYAPRCPICQSKSRRWSNTAGTTGIIKMRCEKDSTHEFSVAQGSLQVLEILPPRVKKEKAQKETKEKVPRARPPKKAALTPEEKEVIRQKKLVEKEAQWLAQKLRARGTKLDTLIPGEAKEVRQREKLMREKIEDQRDLLRQKDPLFDF